MIEVLLLTALLIALPRERQAVEHLRLARRDPLTDLGNRRALDEWLARRDGCLGDIAVLIFDLDRFKSINDTHGHATGDQLLMVAADVARRVLPDSDTIYRIGGDEFLGIFGSSALFVMGILYLGSGTGKSRKSFTFMDIPQCHAFGLLIFPVPSSFVVLLHWTTEWRSKSVCESGVQCVRTVSARHDAFTVSIRENSRIFHGRAVQPR